MAEVFKKEIHLFGVEQQGQSGEPKGDDFDFVGFVSCQECLILLPKWVTFNFQRCSLQDTQQRNEPFDFVFTHNIFGLFHEIGFAHELESSRKQT